MADFQLDYTGPEVNEAIKNGLVALTTDPSQTFDQGTQQMLREKFGIGDPYVLPISTSNTLGGVMPIAKTSEMTQEVGVDAQGRLFVFVPVYVLPVATTNTLGGVMPLAQTSTMTQTVGVDASGKLFTTPPDPESIFGAFGITIQDGAICVTYEE